MKITLIADIHGNLPALEAVLRHARAQNATEMILNMGDLTGYGPFPDGVVQWSQRPRVTSIIGNYDKKVLSKKHRQNNWEKITPADKRKMFAWTYQALTKPSRKALKSLPEQRTLTLRGLRILMTHGSPASINEHLLPDTPQERLAELAGMADADVVLCGHSHQPFTRQARGVTFINPGTVGRQDDGDPRASYATLEITAKGIMIQHHRVPYDIMRTVRGLRLAGLPDTLTHVIRYGRSYNDVRERIEQNQIVPGPDPNGTVALLTDFGIQDHFIGVMKGVITKISPQARLIDISHQIAPQNIEAGARMLGEAVPYFAPGTVQVAVVDPGVGTQRRAIAALIGKQYFVAPDNGLLTPLIENARAAGEVVRIVNLTRPEYWLPEPSASFHGRDIFSPVGAHLANGLPLECLGEAIDDPILINLSKPKRTESGWRAEVVLVDHFGNLSTNLPAEALPADWEDVTVRVGGKAIQGLTRAFADAEPGTLIATVDSTGSLAISVVNGNAAERLKVGMGASVEVVIKK